jgi:hypothetical protein
MSEIKIARNGLKEATNKYIFTTNINIINVSRCLGRPNYLTTTRQYCSQQDATARPCFWPAGPVGAVIPQFLLGLSDRAG